MDRNVNFASIIKIIKHMDIWKAKVCAWQKLMISGLRCKMKHVRNSYVIARLGVRRIKATLTILKFLMLWAIFGFIYYYLAQFLFLLKPYTEIGKIIAIIIVQLMAPVNAIMMLHIPFIKSKGGK